MFPSFLEIAAAVVLWFLFRWLSRRLSNKTGSINNLPGPPAESFWIGNFRQLFRPDAWKFHEDIAFKYGPVMKINGPFGTKGLFVYDPKALHHLVVKDQHVYEEAVHFIASNNAIFGTGLLSTLGDHHRKQRKMLNPVFSIAHMRGMVPIFHDVVFKLRDAFLQATKDGAKEIEIHSWLGRTALELIGQSVLGYSFDPLTEGAKQHPFSAAAGSFGRVVDQVRFFRQYIYPYIYRIGTPRFQRFMVDISPWKAIRDLRDIVDVFHRTSLEIFELKKAELEKGDGDLLNEVGRRKDLMSVLMAANMSASEEDRLPDEEVIGQMSTFTFAGTDTTSNAISRILWLLCVHPEVQGRLRQEICKAKEQHGDLDYDQLSLLPYLDAVCRETLRLYAPVTTLVREARSDTVLPLSKPIRGLDGKEMNEIVIPKDTEVFMSVLSVNRNPELWGPDAFEWKPERWLSSLPDSVTEARIPGVYSNLMTFLAGSRACIGFKFSQLEMKVVLCVLLERFEFALPKDKEIRWNMSGIVKPYVSGPSGEVQTQLPLIVKRCD